MVKACSAAEYADDLCLSIVDVVGIGPEVLKIGTSLSSEPIIALEHNGVPKEVFLQMADRCLNQLRDSYVPGPVEAEGEVESDVLPRLATNLFRGGGVGMDRRKREVVRQGGSTRLTNGMGMKRSDSRDEIDLSKGGSRLIDPAEKYDIDPVTGQSGSLGER
jgi:hypothetical protein